MKLIPNVIILTLVIMVGYQDNNTIVAPSSYLNLEQMPKGRPIIGRDLDDDLFFWDDSSSALKGDGFSLNKETTNNYEEIKSSSDEPIIYSNRYGWTRKKDKN